MVVNNVDDSQWFRYRPVKENERNVFGQKMVSLIPHLLQTLMQNQLLIISMWRHMVALNRDTISPASKRKASNRNMESWSQMKAISFASGEFATSSEKNRSH